MRFLTQQILVVANETATGRELHDTVRAFAIDPAARVHVVAPALNSRVRHWFSDCDAAHDAAGTQVARVERVQTGGGFGHEEMTWALMIERPLLQPLDALILGAGVALNPIQHLNLT